MCIGLIDHAEYESDMQFGHMTIGQGQMTTGQGNMTIDLRCTAFFHV